MSTTLDQRTAVSVIRSLREWTALPAADPMRITWRQTHRGYEARTTRGHTWTVSDNLIATDSNGKVVLHIARQNLRGIELEGLTGEAVHLFRKATSGQYHVNYLLHQLYVDAQNQYLDSRTPSRQIH